MSKNVILWVEDRPLTVSSQIDFCQKKGFEVRVVATAFRLAEILQRERQSICLLVVDIMLFNIMSLDDIDISDSMTEGRYSAGWVVIDRFLRPGTDSSKKITGFPDIPILVLSARILSQDDKDRLEYIKRRGGAWLEYIEKGVIDASGKITWVQKFEGFIKEIPH